MKKYLFIYLFIGWGLAVSGQSAIQSYEYWFNSNTDNKTSEAIASPTASFDLAVQADASHLPDGVNTFTVRFKDDLGNWSSPLTRFFVKIPEQQFSTEPKNIVAYEYRLNNETAVKQVIAPTTTFVLDQQIEATQLPDGLNVFMVRFRDNLGNWSSPLTRFFVKIPEQQFSTEPKNIVACEYRLNNETTIKQEIAPVETFVLDKQIDASQLPDGMNVFMVRFKDDLGNWSSPLTRFFVKIPQIDGSVSENLIKAYEYRVEDASGNSVAGSDSTTFTFVSLDAPINPALIEFEVALNHVPMGDYTVHFRALDIRNQWSSVLSRTVEKEAMPTAEFSFSGGLCSGSAIQFTNESFDTDSWLWDFGDGTESTEFEPEHIYTEAGDYEVSLTATDSESGSVNSVTDIITIYPDYETEATIAICASETPYTFGTQQLTASGAYTETFQTIHSCDSVVTLNLTVHPTYNIGIGEVVDFQVNDDFEEDALGTLAGWTIKYNGSGNANQKVVDNISKNGTKSFQLEGRSSWAADLYKPISSTPDKLTIEAWINVSIANAAASGIGLVNYGAASWGARTSRIDFSNGRIRATCTGGAIYDIQPFTPGEWYHVRVEHDMVARVYSVYIDGQKVSGSSGSNTTDVFPMHPAVSQDFFLCAGNATTTRVYFDDVKMYESREDPVAICSSETPYTFGTQQLTESGTYTETFQTIHGCDSVVTLTLIVNPGYNHTDEQTICEGDTYNFGTQNLTTSGEYTEVFESIHGCDSTVVLTLTVNPVYNHTDEQSVCEGDTYVFGTQNLTTSGEYTEVFESIHGCDSTVVLTLTVNPGYNHTDEQTICEGDTYNFGTQNLTISGEYTEVFESIHGCDSTVVLTLTVNPVYNHTIEVIVSENELPFIFGSSEITESGAYVETFVSINGCDSIVTLNLEVASGDISPPEVVCNPYQVKLRQNGKYVLTKTDIRLITAGTFDDFTSYEDLVIDIYPDTFGCSHVGKDVNVLVTVTDLAGNVGECQSVITVYDKTPPVALCRDITLTLDENGQAFITPADIDQGIPENGYPEWAVTNSGKPYGSYDACGVASIALNKYAFDCGDLGQQLVTLEVTDPSGNFSNCVATVTVVDTSPFSIQPVSDIVLEVAPGVCETETDYPEIAVTGTCGGEVELIEGIGPGGLFPAGTTIETWVATHASGKTDTMSFAVTVIPENDPPTLNPIPNIQADEDTPPLNVVLTGISYGNDCWEQEVTVTAESSGTSLIEEIVVNYEKGSTTGSLVIYIIPDASGKAEVTVTVEDSENAKVSQSFFVEIHPVNDPPFVVNPVPDQEIIVSYVLKLPLNARPGNIFDDIDDEELSFDVTQLGISGLPDWAVVMNDTLYCTPALKDTGCVDMIVTATDASGASAADTFQICVLNYPVGVNNFTVNSLDVELYPNPANDIVNIEINGENPKPVGVTVFTVTGKKVLEKEFYQSNIVSFSMRDHVSGIYFVKIKIENYEKVKKLILNRK
jgi:PKD repeat protein